MLPLGVELSRELVSLDSGLRILKEGSDWSEEGILYWESSAAQDVGPVALKLPLADFRSLSLGFEIELSSRGPVR